MTPDPQIEPTDLEPDIDARGLRCPLPVIALARRAADLPAGSTLTLWADDPAAQSDIPAWARMKGHHVTVTPTLAHTRYHVTLRPDPPAPKSSAGAASATPSRAW